MKRVTFDEVVRVRQLDVGTKQHRQELRAPPSTVADLGYGTVQSSSKKKPADGGSMWPVYIFGVVLIVILLGILCKNTKKDKV